MKLCMAQINTLVGDIAGNTQRVLAVSAAQKAAGAHVVVFPELTLTGYPPEDLVLRGDLLDRSEAALARLCAELPPARVHFPVSIVGVARASHFPYAQLSNPRSSLGKLAGQKPRDPLKPSVDDHCCRCCC